ncbi:hypothetical protein KC340_g3429 [Hortaea werneckii]|nr:hypothetical protein KC339_g744 [Hortaea werneckii]KAI7232019.1 hypothetical protein KC365_g6974 [Hortaea werneckii]KAI7332325.1 hypothetical protein KC340_g3429 [Hortaea werneckii]KAI7393787.1 hypothetical protein KC328_g6433 [Hortaea werneckii]
MDSSKKASSSGGTSNKNKGKGKGSQQQTPSKQSSASRPKSDKTASKEDTKSPKQGSPSNPPKHEQPQSPSPPSKPRATTRTQNPTPRSIFTPANNVNPFTSTVTSAVSTPESQKAHLSSDDDDSPVRRPVDPEAFEEISASEAEGVPGSRKTSAELLREYSHVYQPAVQGPGDEAEFDGDEED